MALHTVCGPGYAHHTWPARKPSPESPVAAGTWNPDEVVYTLPQIQRLKSVGECCVRCTPVFEAYAGHPEAQQSVLAECNIGHKIIETPGIS